MVSPAYKGGYGVSATSSIAAVAPAGDSVAFHSLGTFAGAASGETSEGAGKAYFAYRSEADWTTVPLTAPATLSPAGTVTDYSSTLEQAVFAGFIGPSTGIAQFEGTEAFFLHPVLGGNEDFLLAGGLSLAVQASAQVGYLGGSADLSHIIVESEVPLLSVAGGLTENAGVYDLVSRGGEQPLRLIGLNNKDEPIEPVYNVRIGAEPGPESKASAFGAVAADGEELFFTAYRSGQLYVRLAGARTLQLSRPLDSSRPYGGCGDGGNPGEVPGEVPCPDSASEPAEFDGASDDGTKVFFRTRSPLVSEDKDMLNDLYMATIACPEAQSNCEVDQREVRKLVQISRDSHAGEAADVQGVLSISPDGSRVYFVAHGVLAGENPEGDIPSAGADNLYVYDSATKAVQFVADLCSGRLQSGRREDLRCPGTEGDEGLWMSIGPEAQTAGDGRFLVFSSYAELTKDDTDNARDVYRYDASEGTLTRVSVGEAGFDANGNRNDSRSNSADASVEQPGFSGAAQASIQAELARRAVNEAGSRIVFTTVEPLSPDATNGSVNAYEWHDGHVSLVSVGSDENGVTDAVITPSGGDVFFTTPAKLVSQDRDELKDVYDARTGPGFPVPPAERQACTGDACQGPLTNPAPLLAPGSVTQQPGENVRPSAKRVTARVRRKQASCKHGRRSIRRGRCAKVKRRTHKTRGKRLSRKFNEGGRS